MSDIMLDRSIISTGFSEGLAQVSIDGKRGYVDKAGTMVIEPQFDYAMPFLEGLAAVVVNDKYGYIDKTGNMVMEPQFNFTYGFYDGLAYVTRYKWGLLRVRSGQFIDKAGKVVINIRPRFGAPSIDGVGNFHDGLVVVDIRGKHGYMDKMGKIVIEPLYIPDVSLKRENNFSEGLAAVRVESKKLGYIDKTGTMVIEPQFDHAVPFSEGLAEVMVDDKYGYIDKTGTMVIEPQFDSARSFSEGLAAVVVNDKYGYIDRTGNMVIEPQFDYDCYSSREYRFSEGLAVVVVNDKYGYIDKSGNMVIEPRFDKAGIFSEGLASVYIGFRTFYINKTGETVFEIKGGKPQKP